MEVLELQLRVQGRALLDQSAKEILIATWEFSPLLLKRISEIWKSSAPNEIRVSINVHGTALFITEDWVVSIHGKRLIECVGALCVLLSSLESAFHVPVSVDLLTPQSARDDSNLYKQLDRERRLGRVRGAMFWAITLVVGGLIGVISQQLLS